MVFKVLSIIVIILAFNKCNEPLVYPSYILAPPSIREIREIREVKKLLAVISGDMRVVGWIDPEEMEEAIDSGDINKIRGLITQAERLTTINKGIVPGQWQNEELLRLHLKWAKGITLTDNEFDRLREISQ